MLVLLYVFVDFGQVWELLVRADAGWLVAAVLSMAAGNFLIAYRLNVLLSAAEVRSGTWRVFQAYLKGPLHRLLLPQSYAFLLSVLIQFGRGFTVWLVARSMGDGTAFGYFLVFTPLVFLLNTLPLARSRLGFEQDPSWCCSVAWGCPGNWRSGRRSSTSRSVS